MEIRQTIGPGTSKGFTTEELRDNFLVQNMFVPDRLNFTYTFYDRMIVGGICPVEQPVKLKIEKNLIGNENLLDNREMGIINIGGEGKVLADGTLYELAPRDGLYLGRGTKDVRFESCDSLNPAKFYVLSSPAHKVYESKKISINQAEPVFLGADENSNKRTIYKYIHPEGVKSCQLVMGLTILSPNNVWNTMPPHTHQRRMEVYFYFDLPGDQLVFHYMGEPSQTRHLVLRNEEAVLSPSWSIHAGAGTRNYSFIWGMAGENQTFTDMDAIPVEDIK